MLQDIAPEVYNNDFHIREPQSGDYVLYFCKDEVLVALEAEKIPFMDFAIVADSYPSAAQHMDYLFDISGRKFFLLDERQLHIEAPKGFSWQPLTVFRTLQPRWAGFAGITGSQLWRFYRMRSYCGRCGHSMNKKPDERAMVCPVCQQVDYPKISPGVIVALTDGDRLLLTRYAGRPYKNYALIAGFTEIGETLEDTVRREVNEEVGLQVRNIRYYKNQPWSFSDTLLVGFFAELDGTDEIKCDAEELATAEWIERAAVPSRGADISLTAEMIELFRLGREKQY